MRRAAALGLALACVLIFPGCSMSKYIPAPTERDVAVAGRLGLATSLETLALGRKLYVRRCSSCHSLRKPTQLLPLEWPEMVKRMATNANLKPDQQLAITHYLVAISASLRENAGGDSGSDSPK